MKKLLTLGTMATLMAMLITGVSLAAGGDMARISGSVELGAYEEYAHIEVRQGNEDAWVTHTMFGDMILNSPTDVQTVTLEFRNTRQTAFGDLQIPIEYMFTSADTLGRQDLINVVVYPTEDRAHPLYEGTLEDLSSLSFGVYPTIVENGGVISQPITYISIDISGEGLVGLELNTPIPVDIFAQKVY